MSHNITLNSFLQLHTIRTTDYGNICIYGISNLIFGSKMYDSTTDYYLSPIKCYQYFHKYQNTDLMKEFIFLLKQYIQYDNITLKKYAIYMITTTDKIINYEYKIGIFNGNYNAFVSMMPNMIVNLFVPINNHTVIFNKILKNIKSKSEWVKLNKCVTIEMIYEVIKKYEKDCEMEFVPIKTNIFDMLPNELLIGIVTRKSALVCTKWCMIWRSTINKLSDLTILDIVSKNQIKKYRIRPDTSCDIEIRNRKPNYLNYYEPCNNILLQLTNLKKIYFIEGTISKTNVQKLNNLISVSITESMRYELNNGNFYIRDLSSLPNLKSLIVKAVNKFDNSILSHLANLNKLNVSGCNSMTDLGLKKLINLTSLKLSSNKNFTNEGISHLTNLKTLYLDNESHITITANMTTITKLILCEYQRSKIFFLTNLINLTYLNLKKSAPKSICFDSFTNLKTLYLPDEYSLYYTPEESQQFCNLPIENLAISGCIELNTLCNLTKLKKLKIGTSFAHNLPLLTNITSLSVTNNKFLLDNVPNLQNLKVIGHSQIYVTTMEKTYNILIKLHNIYVYPKSYSCLFMYVPYAGNYVFNENDLDYFDLKYAELDLNILKRNGVKIK